MRRLVLRIIDNELALALIMAAMLVLAVVAECGPSPVSAARRRPVPVDQWDPTTQVWLARAMVGEAGWKSTTDHVAIAWVLARRWETMRKRWPALRFRDVVLRYAKALGGGRRSYTRRQVWIRGLKPDLAAPEGWPRTASWERHRPLWRAALRRAGEWQGGRLRDPCGGQAWHWGGRCDVPWKGLEEIDCGDTRNTFYRLGSSTPGVLARR